MIKFNFNSLLSIILSFAIVQTQVAMAQQNSNSSGPRAIPGVVSPEGKAIYIDPSPSSQGKRVFSANSRTGVIANGQITWSDGKITSLTKAAAEASPKSSLTPSSKTTSSINVLEGAKSPDGKRLVYLEKGPKSVLNGKQRVWSFDQSGKAIQGSLLDPARNIIHWDGQKAPQLVDPLQPSRLTQTMNWDKQRTQSMNVLVQKLKKGDPSLLQEMKEQNVRNLETNRPTTTRTAGMTQIGIGFFLALGVLAYIELSSNYANNPNAWSDFTDSMSDPIGWLMLPAFILATHHIFKYAATMKKWKWFLASSGGMAAGLITTSILGKMLYDPNFKKCLGFTNYDRYGDFTKDLRACDQLKAAWEGEELFLTIMPVIGHAVMAGGMVAGLMGIAKLGLNATQLAEKIKVSATFLKNPRAGGLITAVSGMGGLILFFGAFHISYKIVDLESNLRDLFITKVNPFRNQSGSALPSNLSKLHQSFEAELNNGLRAQVQVDRKDEACVKAAKGFHSAKQAEEICGGFNLDMALEQHQVLMTKWRQLKFSKVDQGYQAWSTRSDAFTKTSTVAHQTYSDFLTDLTMHRQGELDIFAPNYLERLKRNVNESQELNGIDLNYDGLFKNVALRTPFDYILTSMACGPDTRNFSNEGVLSRLGITNPATPLKMVHSEKGEKVVFHPPRLFEASQENICQTHPQHLRSGIKVLDTISDFTPTPLFLGSSVALTPESYFGRFNGENFKGIFEYLTKAIPESLAPSQGESGFSTWWESEVLPSLEKVDQEILVDYQEFLDTTYTNVLTSDSARCSIDANYPLFNGVGQLLNEANLARNCPVSANIRLGEGLSSSVYEQMGFYYHLILKIMERTRLDSSIEKSLMLAHLADVDALTKAIALKSSRDLPDLAAQVEVSKQALSEALNQVSGDESRATARARSLIEALNLAAQGALGEGLRFIEPLIGVGVVTSPSL